MKTTIHYILGHFDDPNVKLLDSATTASNNLPKYLPKFGDIIQLCDGEVRGIVDDIEHIILPEEVIVNIYIEGEERE